MVRVIIVSNRLPVNVKKVDGKLEFSRSVGGVATGLASYMRNPNNRWIGWPGIASDGLTEQDKRQIIAELKKHGCYPVFLSLRQLDAFYNGYSNSVLWPLFHNLPRPKDVRPEWWRAYRAVNKAYAEAVARLSQADTYVWVHDYHLMLVPRLVRRLKPALGIGFFLHIPFPDPAAFAKLPQARQLLNGIAGADLVGFHTASYVEQFLANCQALKVGQVGPDQLAIGNRTVRVTDFPMGIDYQKYATANRLPEVRRAVRAYRRRYRGLKVITSTERLDISKGFIERLQAYRQYLASHPRMRGKVVFALVGAPTRADIAAYQDLARRVQKLVDDINGEFGTARWQPVDYINEVLPFEQVSALNQVADVAFVAPLRDGMNLTPKEFIASKRGRGVVILSDTAGAAEELRDAILVSHRRPETLVAALDQALTMRPHEMRRRLKRMQAQLADNTIHTWAGNFVKTLQKPIPGTPALTYTLDGRRQRDLVAAYRAARRRLILLDYDGSLVPMAEDYHRAAPPKPVLKLLAKLSADEANTVVLISGRSQLDLDKWFGDLRLNLVAEHGALVKNAGQKTWRETVETGRRWKKTVRPVLETYTKLTPRAEIEEKQYSLVWHYRQAPPYYAQKYAVIIQRVLRPIIKPLGIQVFSGRKILEFKDAGINKGVAIRRWLKDAPSFVLAIGDDYTDEDTFAALPLGAYTIKVGRGRSRARFRLGSVDDVHKLLRLLAR